MQFAEVSGQLAYNLFRSPGYYHDLWVFCQPEVLLELTFNFQISTQ